jgi:hypothetical protein
MVNRAQAPLAPIFYGPQNANTQRVGIANKNPHRGRLKSLAKRLNFWSLVQCASGFFNRALAFVRIIETKHGAKHNRTAIDLRVDQDYGTLFVILIRIEQRTGITLHPSWLHSSRDSCARSCRMVNR